MFVLNYTSTSFASAGIAGVCLRATFI